MEQHKPTESRLDQLDGLRTLAVAGVIVQHAFGFLKLTPGSGGFESGAAGVRLFFVLSGFLITGILLRARQSAHERGVSRWNVWKAFYYRRALRILPLAYLVLAIAWLIGSPSLRSHPWLYVLYVSNFNVAAHGFTDPSLDHFWSLAIEEQFYLFWPFVLLAVPRRWTPAAMVATIVAAMFARATILVDPDPNRFVRAMVMTPSRLDALAFGGLLAWYHLTHPERPARTIVGLIVAAVTALFIGRFADRSIVLLPFHETGNVLLSAALVLWAAVGLPGFVGRLLAARPLVALGTISYGIYVYHMVIAGLLPIAAARFDLPIGFPGQYGWTRFIWMVGTTLPVSALSWALFERPLNDLKVHFPYLPRQRAAVRPAVVSRSPAAPSAWIESAASEASGGPQPGH